MGALVATTLLTLLAVVSRAQAADDSDVRCMASYEHGQRLKAEGKLSSASVEFRVCKETCPPVFAQDCGRWLRDTEVLMPTVRFYVKDGQGRPVSDLRVSVDGQLLGDPAPADAVPVDAGTRVFRFERGGAQPVEVRVTLQPGERDHRIEVTIAAAPALAPLGMPSLAENHAPRSDAKPTSRVPSYALGALGAAALVVAGGLLVQGHIQRADLAETCSPRCHPSEADPIRTLWWASAATAGAGLLSLGVAFLLWPGPLKAKVARLELLLLQ